MLLHKMLCPVLLSNNFLLLYKLLTEINRQAAKAGRTVNCLLQLHIAQEETKFGFSFDECREMLAGDDLEKRGIYAQNTAAAE